MPKLSLSIPHKLTQDEAAQRLKTKFASAKTEYQERVSDFREDWRDHSLSFGFRILGMAISGTVAVEPTNIRLAADLPWGAAFFRSAIEDRVRQEVDTLLS
jgi:predicted NBD/HSP70 family sugar kinase